MALDLYTPAEAAKPLGVSPSTVWRLIRNNELPSVVVSPKPGMTPRKRIRATDLEAFIKERTNAA